MSERDELAATIETAYDLNPGMATFELLAHAILAAGYRRPQQITTAFALEEVPKGTLILAANGEVWRKYTHKWDNLDETGDLIYPPHHIALPATVLQLGSGEE